jgi:hypothetical protein
MHVSVIANLRITGELVVQGGRHGSTAASEKVAVPILLHSGRFLIPRRSPFLPVIRNGAFRALACQHINRCSCDQIRLLELQPCGYAYSA